MGSVNKDVVKKSLEIKKMNVKIVINCVLLVVDLGVQNVLVVIIIKNF